MKNITEKEWVEKLSTDDNAIIIDVRTPEEWQGGVLKNALCLDIFKTQTFLSEIEKLDQSKNYYVYCRSGHRSAHACQMLDELGMQNTYNLIGGIIGWSGEIVRYEP